MEVKTLLLYFLFIGLAFLVTLNYVGDYNGSQDKEEFKIKDYATINFVREWVNWKLDNEVHPNIQELNSTTLKIYTDKDRNREAIADLRLFVLRELKESETVPPQSPTPSTPFAPLVTLTVAKTEYGLGQTLIFSGSGVPGTTAILNVIKAGGCGQNDNCSEWAKIDNNGSYRIEFPTEFDDTPGLWRAYVRVGDLRSETVTFDVV